MKTLLNITIAAIVSLCSIGLTVAAAETIANGTAWDNVEKKTAGAWSIVEKADGTYIEFADNFKTRKVPDLKLYLSTADANSLNDNNGLDNTTFVAKMSSHKGSQTYKLPENLTASDFTSLVIYCEAYSKFWAAANL